MTTISEKYVLVGKLGSGAHGEAELVRSRSDNQLYVIKHINMSRYNTSNISEIINEVKALRRLQNEFIVRYNQFFINRTSNTLSIVMEYCDRGDLATRIEHKTEPLPESQILDWFVQISLALGDIKLSNVFLSGSIPVCKLGDFGTAKILSDTLELANTVIGTPYSLSPEVCQSRPYSFKSDIWALGCLLYEMATGHHLYESNNLLGLVFKIVQLPPPSLPSHYSADLQELLSGLLEKDPQKRPVIGDILATPFLKDYCEKWKKGFEPVSPGTPISPDTRITPSTPHTPYTSNTPSYSPDIELKIDKFSGEIDIINKTIDNDSPKEDDEDNLDRALEKISKNLSLHQFPIDEVPLTIDYPREEISNDNTPNISLKISLLGDTLVHTFPYYSSKPLLDKTWPPYRYTSSIKNFEIPKEKVDSPFSSPEVLSKSIEEGDNVNFSDDVIRSFLNISLASDRKTNISRVIRLPELHEVMNSASISEGDKIELLSSTINDMRHSVKRTPSISNH